VVLETFVPFYDDDEICGTTILHVQKVFTNTLNIENSYKQSTKFLLRSYQ